MDFKFKYNSAHIKLLEGYYDIGTYSKLSEFEHEQVKDFIPIQPKVIMDLGCGLGRASVYLNWILHPHDVNNDIHFILADSCEKVGGWIKDDYFRSLDLTASFCTLNGLLNFGLFDVDKSDWNGISNIDYVMSRCGYGVHAPIESIMDRLLKITTGDVTMIFGTRNREVYSQNSFKDIFKEVYFIEESEQKPFPNQDWLILRGKK